MLLTLFLLYCSVLFVVLYKRKSCKNKGSRFFFTELLFLYENVNNSGSARPSLQGSTSSPSSLIIRDWWLVKVILYSKVPIMGTLFVACQSLLYHISFYKYFHNCPKKISVGEKLMHRTFRIFLNEVTLKFT